MHSDRPEVSFRRLPSGCNHPEPSWNGQCRLMRTRNAVSREDARSKCVPEKSIWTTLINHVWKHFSKAVLRTFPYHTGGFHLERMARSQADLMRFCDVPLAICASSVLLPFYSRVVPRLAQEVVWARDWCAKGSKSGVHPAINQILDNGRGFLSASDRLLVYTN